MANASNSGILNNGVPADHKPGLLQANDIKSTFPQLVAPKPQSPVVFHVFAPQQANQQAVTPPPTGVTVKMKPQTSLITTPQHQVPSNQGMSVVKMKQQPQSYIFNAPPQRLLQPGASTVLPVTLAPQNNFISTQPQGQPSFVVPTTTLPVRIRHPNNVFSVQQQVSNILPAVTIKPANSVFGSPQLTPQFMAVSSAASLKMKPQNHSFSGIPQSTQQQSQPLLAPYGGLPAPQALVAQQQLQQIPRPQSAPQHQPATQHQPSPQHQPSAQQQPTSQQPTPQQPTPQQQLFENMKKCKNFLQTLIKLASNQQEGTVQNVRRLIQELINGNLEPESFTEKLQTELHSSPQPYLIPFLRKNLPLLRYYMIQGKTKIEGVHAPPLEVMKKHPIPHNQALVHSSLANIANQTQAQHSQQASTSKVAVPLNGKMKLLGSIAAKCATTNPQMTKQLQALVAQQLLHQNHKLTPQQVQQLVQKQLQQQQLQTLQSQGLRPLAPVPTRPINAQHHPPASSQVSNRPSLAKISPSTVQALSSGAAAKSSPQPPPRDKRKYDSLRDDDDINDVATMGGVNLSEESKNILSASSSILSTQMRSCKDESLLNSPSFHKYLASKARQMGLSECSKEAAEMIGHAAQELLKQLLQKLSVLAEHRLENYRVDPRVEQTVDTRQQLKFLEEIDKKEQKRQEDAERETLIRAAKSRSKNEDPEQLKLKEKAKALQQAEQDQRRQQQANLTALAAIGTYKRRKLDDSGSSTPGSSFQRPQPMNRPRIKRVHLRDIIFLLEQDRRFDKSHALLKAYHK